MLLYIKIKLNFLLIQPPCQISKILYGKSIPCDYLRTALSTQNITNSNQPSKGVTKVRNGDFKMNHLSFDLHMVALTRLPVTQ